MIRRAFIGFLGGAVFFRPGRATPQDRPRRVGALMAVGKDDRAGQSWAAAFARELQALGWTEGRNLELDYRWAAGDVARAKSAAQDLIRWQPDVVLANSTIATKALRNETSTIPIVFTNLTDPVDQGFVASLARPGGNVTGFSNYEPLITTKWVETLQEIAPKITRVLAVFNPETTPKPLLGLIGQASKSLSLDVSLAPVENSDDLKAAIAGFAKRPAGGLIIMPGGFTASHRDEIVGLSAQNRLPAIYGFSYWVEHGGLLSYGVDVSDLFRRAAIYVDRILKGARPSDLPVQAPTKFELAINLETAKSLGLAVAPMLLATADEVIQ